VAAPIVVESDPEEETAETAELTSEPTRVAEWHRREEDRLRVEMRELLQEMHAMDYDDRLWFSGPARVVGAVTTERLEYTAEVSLSETIPDADLVVGRDGRLGAPDALPSTVRDAVRNLPAPQLVPEPTLVSRTAERVGSGAARHSLEKLEADTGAPLPGAGGGVLLTDHAVENFNCFYMCPGCGFYAAPCLWKHARLAKKEAWYCGVSWLDFKVLLPQQYQDIMKALGTEDEADDLLGCGRRWRPWAKGAASILEFRNASTEGGWACLVAELPPPVLQDALTKCATAFCTALHNCTATELCALLPGCWPKLNPLAALGLHVPGIGKIDMIAYNARGSPLVNEEAWWRFARAIAGRNITLLRDVFDISSSSHGR
jgi:hypothetical protein